MNWTPGPLNSILIKTENAVPNNPENNAKIKYKVPLEMEPASRLDPLKEPCVPVTRHTAQPSINLPDASSWFTKWRRLGWAAFVTTCLLRSDDVGYDSQCALE